MNANQNSIYMPVHQSCTSDMDIVTKMRYALFANVYGPRCNDLIGILSKHIISSNIGFDPNTFTISIKVKKTAMNAISRFRHQPDYYYQFIADAFYEFFMTYKEEIIAAWNNTCVLYPGELILDYLINYKSLFTAMCHISCITDNVLIIKL